MRICLPGVLAVVSRGARWWLVCLALAGLSLAGAAAAEPAAKSFDGNASLSYPADVAFDLGTEGTIEFWVQADWREPLGADACVVANGDASSSRYAAYISADGQAVVLWDGAKSAGAAFNFLDGEAHHVAIVTRGAQSQFFVDGELRDTRPIGYGTVSGKPLHIGTSDGSAEGFVGLIESVRIWSSALTPAEALLVSTFAGSPSAGSTLLPHLRAYTDFTTTGQDLVVNDPPAPGAGPATFAAPAPGPAADPAPKGAPTADRNPVRAVGGATAAAPASAAPVAPAAQAPVQMWRVNAPANRWRQPAPAIDVMAEVRQGAIDFWMAWDPGAPPEELHSTILAYSNGYDTVFEVGVTPAGDGIVVANGKRDEYGQVVESSNIVSTDFTDGQPHHVALLTHEETTEVFVDGVSQGIASVGYAIAEDARGPKTNLQLAIGSFDGRTRAFTGDIGAVRLWAARLPAQTLHQAAFLRDGELKSVPWVDAFLLAHLENVAGRTTKPALKILPPLYLPSGVWMSSTEPARHRETLGDPTGEDGEWAFNPQNYIQLVVVNPDDPLGRYTSRRGTGAAAAPLAVTERGAGATPAGFRVTAQAGIGGRPEQTTNGGTLADCADTCRGAGPAACAGFDFVPSVARCEIHRSATPLRTGVAGSFSYSLDATAMTARPLEKPDDAKVPLLVWLDFTPYQSIDAPEVIGVRTYRPNGRNRYLADNGQTLVLTSKIHLKAGGRTMQRFDVPDRPPRPGQPKMDDVFIVSNQVRNLRSALHGWDPVLLNPFDFSNPQGGKKADIFAYPAYGYTQSARMVIPKGFEFVDLQSGSGRREHTEVTTEAEMQQAFGAMISVSGGAEGMVAAGSFSANASFNAKSKVLNSGVSAFTIGQAVNRRAALLIDKANARLAEPFVLAVQQAVSGNPDLEAARDLVETFGTHYPHAVVLGGRLIEIVELDSVTWGTIESYDIGVGAAVEGRVGPADGPNASASAALSADVGFENSFRQTIQKSKDSWTTSGGQGGAATGNWSVSDDTMAPIYLDLRPISELLAPPFFLDPVVFDQLRPLVREAMIDYVVRMADPISLDRKFVPRTIARQSSPQPKRDCDVDSTSFRKAFSSDSDGDNGGGVWVQFNLPAKRHFEPLRYDSGCTANSFWEDGWLIECNRICWENATFLCKDGQWEQQAGYKMTTDLLCHDSGKTEQDHLLKGTGKAPWQ